MNVNIKTIHKNTFLARLKRKKYIEKIKGKNETFKIELSE